MFPLRRSLLGAATVLALPLAGCSGGVGSQADAPECVAQAIPAETASPGPSTSPEPTPTPAADDQDPRCDEVTFLTAFGLFGRDAWIFCGIEQGFFAERGIEVQVQAGSGTEENVALLVAGRAEFTVSDMVGNLILASLSEEAGEEPGFRAVAALQQNNLSVWMTMDPDLQTVQDLEGHTVGMAAGGVVPLLWPTYVELAGGDPAEIEIQTISGNTEIYAALGAGQVDAIGAFAVGLPLALSLGGGREVGVRSFSDVLTDLYGNALLARDETIAEDPDLVARFRDGLLESLEWSLANQPACTEIMGEYVAGQPPEVAGRELALLRPYVHVGALPVGAIDEVRVARMIGTLEAAGTIDEGLTPQDVVAFELAPAAEVDS